MAQLLHRRTHVQLVGFIACLFGLGFSRYWPSFTSGPVLVGMLLFLVCVHWHRFIVLGVLALGCCLGSWRGAQFARQEMFYKQNIRKSVVLQVVALDDAIYGEHSQLTFTGGDVTLNGQKLPGKIQVSGFGLPVVFQGDIVEVNGKLSPGYGAYQGSLKFGALTLVGRHPTPLTFIKRQFDTGVETALPEPLASFSLGLLIGQRATLPDTVKQDLLMVGLTHIIAVSGYNLTIMLNASKRLFQKRSKRLSTALALILMASFVMITGGSASIVRAAIVSTFSLWAAYYGRTFKPINLICFAAALTGFIYPFYVWGDMSWYLSFLAFYGVLAVSPIITSKLPEWARESVVIAVAIESIAAEVMTLPFILHFFGQMSLVSLPANMLVVALVPLAMLLSFIAGLAGMLIPSFAGWVAWPAKEILNYMLDTAHILSTLPHVFLENIELGLGQMIGIYVVVLGVVYWHTRKTKSNKYATITDKKTTNLKGVQLERA